ncbi:MAG: hypothetical protein V7765_21225 [Oleispira sp.]
MDSTETSFLIAPFIMLSIAAIKRTSVAAWMALGMCIGFCVIMSEPTDFNAMVWACCCNSLLLFAMRIHFNKTKLILPVVISITLFVEVFASFFNLISIANGSTAIQGIGWITGLITYIQILLVFMMDDKKGSLLYVLDDLRNLPGSIKRLVGIHKH